MAQVPAVNNPPSTIELLKMMFAGGANPAMQGPPMPPAPVAPRAPLIPLGDVMTAQPPSQGYTGFDPTPLMLMAQEAVGSPSTAEAVSNYGKTWSQPGFNLEYPLPRNMDQTGPQNIAAGMGNGLINLPQTMWQAYSGMVGQPFANAVGPVLDATGNAMQDAFAWMTTPEKDLPQNQPAAAAAPAPGAGFTPGLPQGPAATAPGSPTVTKMLGAENSTGNPVATNPASSAMGNGQFIKSTWLEYANEVHPEWKGKSEAEILAMRADPNLAAEATSWYAGKAVDMLDSIDAPATDANIYLHHFLGPLGAKSVLLADPTLPIDKVLDAEAIAANPSVLGGARTVQDVLDWANVKMGDYQPGAPAPRPQIVMPDFSAANNFYEAARPQAADPALIADQRLANMLAGIGQGLGQVNASQDGGAALFGALAAGTGAANSTNQNMMLDFDNQFKQDTAAYNAGRGQIASTQAGEVAEAANQNAERGWLDQQDQQNYNTTMSQQQAQKEAEALLKNTPQIIESSAAGLWIKTPEGGIEYLAAPNTDGFEETATAFGLDSGMARQYKYSQMATQPGMNILTFQQEVVKDVLKDGLGPVIWGDAYTEALAAAQELLPPGAAADPEMMQAETIKILSGLLLGASQSQNSYDWILQAAAQGNPGAIMLTQNGSQQ